MENKSHLISADNVAVGSPVSIENTTAPFDTSSASEATSGNSDCEAKQDSSVAVASADSSAPSASTSEIPSAFTPNSGGAASEMTSMVAGSSVSADAPTDSRENSAAEAAVDSTVAAAPTAAAGVNAILAPAPTKIRVNLQAVGSAPILKKTKFAIGGKDACTQQSVKKTQIMLLYPGCGYHRWVYGFPCP